VNSKFGGFGIRTGPIPPVFAEFQKIRPVFVTLIERREMGKGPSEREEAREGGVTGEESGWVEDNWISIVFFFSPPVVSIFLFLGLILFFFPYSFSLLTSSLLFFFSPP
jgi:hypothetical protein